MFKLNAKFNADPLLYSLSHLQCNGRTVHMFTQQHLLPPLTSTVKSLLFLHAHSSPLFLAAGLYQWHTNHSCYTNKGHTFFQTDLVYLCYKINFLYLRKIWNIKLKHLKDITLFFLHFLSTFTYYLNLEFVLCNTYFYK